MSKAAASVTIVQVDITPCFPSLLRQPALMEPDQDAAFRGICTCTPAGPAVQGSLGPEACVLLLSSQPFIFGD